MKKILTSTDYVFSAASKTIDFFNLIGFDAKRVMAVINTTSNQTLIYATGGGSGSPTGGSFSGNILTLNYDTTSMADTDNLQIIYDTQSGVEDAKSTMDVVTGKLGADVNLLNSSFGGEIGSVLPSVSPDNALSVAILNGGILSAPAMNVNDELIVDVTQSGSVPVTVGNAVTSVLFDSLGNALDLGDGGDGPSTLRVAANLNLQGTNVSSGSGVTDLGTIRVALATDNSPNINISKYGNTSTTLGQKVSASSMPVVIASDNTVSTDIARYGGAATSLGQKVAASSIPVVLASDASMFQDLNITGQAAQTATINNIIPVTASGSATDASGYKSATIQVVSTGTAGTFIFEGSNDNVNFAAIPVYNQVILTGTPITTAITATVSQIVYTLPIQTRYIRLRIATTITGGSIQAFTRLSQTPFAPAVQQIAQGTAANLLTTVSGSLTTVTTVTTVSAVTSASLASATTTDITSAAITTTQTSANISTLNSQAASWLVSVTAISGTTPSMDVVIQETMDATNYYTIYAFERITANGQYYSPCIKLSGSGYRVVRTVNGTTPSITNSVVRISRSGQAETMRRFIDRAIDLNTLNSVSGSYFCEGVEDFNLIIRCTAQTTPATVALEFSMDNTNWLTTTSTLATVAGISQVKTTNEQWKFVRAKVTAAGSGITLDNLVIGGHSA